MQRSASLPIIPLTPGGILIPFQPSQTPGLKPGLLPRAGGYPSNLRNFNDIRQQMQQRRDQLFQSLQQANYNRIPSPPVISAAPRNPTVPSGTGNLFSSGVTPGRTPFPSLTPGTYTGPSSAGATPGRTPFPSLTPGTYTGLSPAGATLGRTPFPSLTPGAYTGLSPAGATLGRTPFPSLTPGAYTRPTSSGLAYSQPSLTGSVGSASSAPYNPLRP